MSWYSGLKVNESNFYRLARNFFAVQLPVFGSKLSLRSANIEGLAYADQKSRSIVVLQDFMRGTHKSYRPYDWPTRLELFDAIIIHEAAHFLLSPKTIGGFELPGRKLTNNIAAIANTVEDLYIEMYVERNMPNFRQLLYRMNDMLFPDKMIEERRSRISGERPTTLDEVHCVIDFAISFKRHNYLFIPRSDFERTLYEMYVSVFNMDSVEERKKLVYEIYDFIVDSEQQEEDSKESDGGEAGAGEGEVSIDSVMASFGEEGMPKFFMPMRSALRDEVDNSTTDPVYHVEVSEHKDIFVERVKPSANPAHVVFNEIDFRELTKIENARGAVRSVVGAPAYSGKNIKHLHRAGGHGKIFGELKLDGHRAGKGSPEVVFLLDFSGSMRGTMLVDGVSSRVSKVIFAMSAAIAINNALSKTKTKFSILGHTTTYRGDKYGLVMVEIKNMNEIVSDEEIRRRCKSVHGSIQYAGNADGAALLYSAKEFSKSSGDKVLFIVSDGQPAEDFTGYYIDNGIPSSALVDSLQAWRYGLSHHPVIIFSHGWGGRGGQFASWVAACLAEGYQVIVFDHAAHGASGGRRAQITAFANGVADVTLALEQQGVSIAAFIGHSLGCPAIGMALNGRLKHLRHVKVILVAPPASLIRYSRFFARTMGLSERLRAAMQWRLEQRIGLAWKDIELPGAVKHLKVPALIIHDQEDQDVRIESGLAVARAWPGARFKRTIGLGHRRILREASVIGASLDFLADRVTFSLPPLPEEWSQAFSALSGRAPIY